LLARDSSDFAAWFGLGDCNAWDSLVVRDSRSPTGYSFRGSIYTAVLAYRRALSLVPSYHLAERGTAFERLTRRVLYTEESRARRGDAAPPDTQTFVAFPSFIADTLAFVPIPYRVASVAPSAPPTEREAVRWSAETYQQIMAEWVAAFPARADAQEGYASALEAASAISGSVERLPDALGAARRAVSRSTTDDARVSRTATVVRLLVKMDSLPAARTLVDSALRTWRVPSAHQAGYLAALATLTGRARLAAALAAKSASDSQHVPFVAGTGRRAKLPVPVTAGALELRVYASLGGPRDSLRSALLRTARLVDVWVPPAGRIDARQSVLRNSFALAYDVLAPIAPFTIKPGRDPLLAMHVTLATGDTSAVRRQSQEFDRQASKLLPGTMGTERRFNHATILLALRDTAAAIEQLDAALSALPRVRSILTEVPPQAGAVGRSMTLRAQLAVARGDRPTAERWTRDASVLWADADPEFRAQLDALRRQLALQ
jgi:hypothetical protein